MHKDAFEITTDFGFLVVHDGDPSFKVESKNRMEIEEMLSDLQSYDGVANVACFPTDSDGVFRVSVTDTPQGIENEEGWSCRSCKRVPITSGKLVVCAPEDFSQSEGQVSIAVDNGTYSVSLFSRQKKSSPEHVIDLILVIEPVAVRKLDSHQRSLSLPTVESIPDTGPRNMVTGFTVTGGLAGLIMWILCNAAISVAKKVGIMGTGEHSLGSWYIWCAVGALMCAIVAWILIAREHRRKGT